MKNSGINNWVQLKKQTPHFTTIMNCRQILKRSTPWNDMSLFFKEADKHINK